MNVANLRRQTMAGKRFKPNVRKVTLDQLILTLFLKGNSCCPIRITIVVVVTVFILNLISVFHMEKWSTRERHGQFENEMFLMQEAVGILPVRQRDMVASYNDRIPPESIFMDGNKVDEFVPFDVIERRERRDNSKRGHRSFVQGNAQRRTELGLQQIIINNPKQDGDVVKNKKTEKRKEHGVSLTGETKASHRGDLSSGRNTVQKPHTERDLTKKDIKWKETKGHVIISRPMSMSRYNNTLKDPGNGLGSNNGHIRPSKTLYNNIISRQRRRKEKLKSKGISYKNTKKEKVFHLREGMEVLKVANKTAMKTRAGFRSHRQGKKIKSSIMNDRNIGGSCARLITIYTSSIAPFRYWPAYSDLRRLFEDGKSYSGNIASSPTGYVICPGQPCDINLIPTHDDTILAASDAVLLNVAPLLARPNGGNISERLLNTLPKKVKIILYGMESANMMTIWDNSIRDIQFHYSMTYHSSSDLVHPYGRYIRGNPMDESDEPVDYTKGKTRILAWMASNCNFTFWPRYEWVMKLQEFIQVDIYGKCGRETCLPRFSEKCFQMMRSYKFYLALENTQCDEYITEKFWDNSLLNGVVPVVYGGRRETYERLAPPGSFIYAADFASPKELADFLITLDKDDDRYNKFFAWRKVGRVEKIYPNLKPTAFCDLQPLLSKGYDERVPIKRAGDTEYFLGCRQNENAHFIKKGDINNWSPWK